MMVMMMTMGFLIYFYFVFLIDLNVFPIEEYLPAH